MRCGCGYLVYPDVVAEVDEVQRALGGEVVPVGAEVHLTLQAAQQPGSWYGKYQSWGS